MSSKRKTKRSEMAEFKDSFIPEMIEEHTETLIEIVSSSECFDSIEPHERTSLIYYLFSAQRAMFLRFVEPQP